MTLHELLAEQRIDEAQRLCARHWLLDPKPRPTAPGTLRTGIAATLVRLGARLDRRAAERIVLAAHRAC